MDLSNAILTSVYPHQQGDASSASDALMSNMVDNQLNGHLVRISPNAFIYMTNDTDDNGSPCPSCHLVVSTDTDHYVGGLSLDSSNNVDDSVDDTSDSTVDDGSTVDTADSSSDSCDSCDDDSVVMPLDDVVPFDPSETDDSLDSIDTDATPAPTSIDSIDVQPAPDADVASAIVEPIVTTLALAVDVVNDQNDMLNTELDEAKCNDDKNNDCKDTKLDESAYIEYPHQVENLDEAIQQISTALTNRYGGSIILHEDHCLTHVRKDGLVDKVQAVQGKYKIRTHKLKV